MWEKEVKERKPSLMTLKQEVISKHPEIKQMEYKYTGYANELSSLGLRVDKDIITMMSVMRHQESGSEWLASDIYKYGELWAKWPIGKKLEDRWLMNRPWTLGPLQLNIHDFRKLLCNPKSKSQFGGKCMLDDINYIIQKYAPDLQQITDPEKLSYEDLDELMKNNAITFYVTYTNLWDHSRNLESMARRAVYYDPEDVMYTTHFLHNHTPQSMYSAIVIQNILELARTPQFSIDFQKVGIDESRDRDRSDLKSKPFSIWDKKWSFDPSMNRYGLDKINLNGMYTDVIDKIVRAMNEKIIEENKKINDINESRPEWEDWTIRKSLISVQKNKSWCITAINGVSLFGKQWFQVEEFQKIFMEYNMNFYPLLSQNFVEQNKDRVHDEYNFAFRDYMFNDIPGWNEKFAWVIPPVNEYSDKIGRLQWLKYDPSRKNASISRVPWWSGQVSGNIDQTMLAAYMCMDITKIPPHYSYVGQSEINTFSLLWWLGNTDSLYFHDMLSNPSIVDQDSFSMITPNSYQKDDIFQIIPTLEPGMLVGFGNELPVTSGGKLFQVTTKPGESKKEIPLNLSSGAVITRVSANQVRVAFADDQSGVVSEVPLFGGWWLYQKLLGTAFQVSNTSPRKNIVFAKLQKEKLEQEREIRLSQMNDNQIVIEDDKSVFILDNYKVHHRSWEIIKGKKVNYCVQNARENMDDMLAGNKRYIKYGDAKDITTELLQKAAAGKDLSIETERVDGSKGMVNYKHLHADDIDIVSSEAYEHEYGVLAKLDAVKNSCSSTNVPIIAEIYVDTEKWHKFIAVRWSMWWITDRYIIDSLRGASSKNPNKISLASEYFANTSNFYTKEERAKWTQYHDLFIRSSAVGDC